MGWLFKVINRGFQYVARVEEISGIVVFVLAFVSGALTYMHGLSEVPQVWAIFIGAGVFAFAIFSLNVISGYIAEWRLKEKVIPLGVEFWAESREGKWHVGFVLLVENRYAHPLHLFVKENSIRIGSQTTEPGEKMHVTPLLPAGIGAKIFTPAVILSDANGYLVGKLMLRLGYGQSEARAEHVMACEYDIYFSLDNRPASGVTSLVSEGIRSELTRLEYSIA